MNYQLPFFVKRIRITILLLLLLHFNCLSNYKSRINTNAKTVHSLVDIVYETTRRRRPLGSRRNKITNDRIDCECFHLSTFFIALNSNSRNVNDTTISRNIFSGPFIFFHKFRQQTAHLVASCARQVPSALLRMLWFLARSNIQYITLRDLTFLSDVRFPRS